MLPLEKSKRRETPSFHVKHANVSRDAVHPLDPVDDGMAIRGPTRLLLIIDGDRFSEVDPRTGNTLSVGVMA